MNKNEIERLDILIEKALEDPSIGNFAALLEYLNMYRRSIKSALEFASRG